jgi:hypothetical protein
MVDQSDRPKEIARKESLIENYRGKSIDHDEESSGYQTENLT